MLRATAVGWRMLSPMTTSVRLCLLAELGVGSQALQSYHHSAEDDDELSILLIVPHLPGCVPVSHLIIGVLDLK